MRSVPRHNVLVIGGDMNAHIGKDNLHHKFSFHQTTNRNGEHFLHFLIENKLHCLNTRFQKRSGKKWTHTHPNGSKAQLDYLIMNKKWINSCYNWEAFNMFVGVSTDQRIATSTIRMSLRANKTRESSRPPYNWSSLANDVQVRNEFTITLRNRFDALQAKGNDPTPNTVYQNFVRVHQEAAKKCIPLRPKIKRKAPWESDAVIAKRENLKRIAKQSNRYPTRQNVNKKKQALNELNAVYQTEQQNYIQDQIDKIKNAAENNQSSLAWKIVNDVSDRKQSSKAKLKVSSQNDRLSKWKDHFQNLLGRAPVISDQPIQPIISEELNIKKGPFSADELEVVLKKTKNRKAAGLDDIPPEVWKTGHFNDILLQSCNVVYQQQEIQFRLMKQFRL